MRTTDTIAAIATPMSESGIGIVRLSGEDAIEIADKIFRGRRPLKEEKTYTIHYGHVVEDGEVIDEVLVMLMRAPKSFTGEDTVEFDCHGGVLVVQRVLEALLRSGANLAEPGEFTKRAFLNGKMDLAQAEAVIDIIEAKNTYALQSGMRQLRGSLTEKISNLRAKILEEIAFIEAALDDPEHYSLEHYPKTLKKKLAPWIEEISVLIRSYTDGVVMKEGIDTVILGRPNAGKSSLLNLLAKKERAIVTDIAGTTRDTLTEHIKMAGISLNITDTAGIRQSEDVVEQIGVSKAKLAAEDADLVLCVLDGLEELSEDDREILQSIQNKKAIVLVNKSDKETVLHLDKVREHTAHKVIAFSAKEGTGSKEMEDAIKEMFYHGKINFNDQVYVTNIRHKECLEEAKDSLEMVLQSIAEGQPEDFFSIDLLNAYELLGSITGETMEDDVVNEIFSKFCMGK